MPSKITITTLSAFDPPGYPLVDDKLDEQQRASWSNTISDMMTLEIEAESRDAKGKLEPLTGPNNIIRKPLTQFFNGSVTPFDIDQKPIRITWNAFPNIVTTTTGSDQQRWTEADSTRGVQDEYLEWSVKKDQDGRIIYVNLTCEGPEYWEFLAQNAPDTLLSLYKSLNPEFANQMKLEDLFDSHNKYNPFNKWNGVTTHNKGNTLTTVNPGCIVHLAQVNNTLSAEIDIAAQATVIRKDPQGNIVKDATKLCNCSQYGDAERNSDPTIGIAINNLARNGVSVSVANPVALYMNSFQTANFMLDADGTGNNLQPVPDKTFTWVRGDVNKAMGLRLHIQIPDGVKGTGGNAGRQLTVSDIFDTNKLQNIVYGAQFADYISMGVAGVGISGGTPAAAQYCPKPEPQSNENENGSVHLSSFTASGPPVGQRRVIAGGNSIAFKTRSRH